MKIRTGSVQEAVDLAKRMPDFTNPYNLNVPDDRAAEAGSRLDRGTRRRGRRISRGRDTQTIRLQSGSPAYCPSTASKESAARYTVVKRIG